MIKLLLKTIAFLVLVVVMLSQLDNVFYKDHFYRDTINQYKNSDKDFDIVFFGNSHSHSSFDPRIFEIALGAKSINLGSPAQRLVTTSVVVDMVLDEQPPDLAVVNIFSLSLNESGNEKYKAFQLETLDFLPHSKSKATTLMEMFPFNEWPTAFSKTLRNHFNWDNRNSINKPYSYSDKYDVYKGFVTYKTSYTKKAYKKFEKQFAKRDRKIAALKDAEKKRIDAIINQFEEKKVPVLFVNTPNTGYDVSDTFKTYAIAIGKYLESNGQQYLDFNLVKDAIGITPRDFRDPNHLNTRGSIKTSQYLADFIKNRFDFDRIITPEQLQLNRYYHIESGFKEAIKSLDLKSDDSLPSGIKAIHLYQSGSNLELAFQVDSIDATNNFKGTLYYSLEENMELNRQSKQSIKVVPKNGIAYAGSKYIFTSIYESKEAIYDLEIVSLKGERPTIFKWENREVQVAADE